MVVCLRATPAPSHPSNSCMLRKVKCFFGNKITRQEILYFQKENAFLHKSTTENSNVEKINYIERHGTLHTCPCPGASLTPEPTKPKEPQPWSRENQGRPCHGASASPAQTLRRCRLGAPCAGAVHSYDSQAIGVSASEGEAGGAPARLSPDTCDCPWCLLLPHLQGSLEAKDWPRHLDPGRGHTSTAEASGHQVDPLQRGAPVDGSSSLTALPCSRRPQLPQSRWQEEAPDQSLGGQGGWMTPSPCEEPAPEPTRPEAGGGGTRPGLPAPALASVCHRPRDIEEAWASLQRGSLLPACSPTPTRREPAGHWLVLCGPGLCGMEWTCH